MKVCRLDTFVLFWNKITTAASIVLAAMKMQLTWNQMSSCSLPAMRLEVRGGSSPERNAAAGNGSSHRGSSSSIFPISISISISCKGCQFRRATWGCLGRSRSIAARERRARARTHRRQRSDSGLSGDGRYRPSRNTSALDGAMLRQEAASLLPTCMLCMKVLQELRYRAPDMCSQ